MVARPATAAMTPISSCISERRFMEDSLDSASDFALSLHCTWGALGDGNAAEDSPGTSRSATE